MVERDQVAIADWKDVDGLLEGLGGVLLSQYKLRLTVHEVGDDNWWVTVTPASLPTPTAAEVVGVVVGETL